MSSNPDEIYQNLMNKPFEMVQASDNELSQPNDEAKEPDEDKKNPDVEVTQPDTVVDGVSSGKIYYDDVFLIPTNYFNATAAERRTENTRLRKEVIQLNNETAKRASEWAMQTSELFLELAKVVANNMDLSLQLLQLCKRYPNPSEDLEIPMLKELKEVSRVSKKLLTEYLAMKAYKCLVKERSLKKSRCAEE